METGGVKPLKAQPVILVSGKGYIPCGIEEATYLRLNIPGPSELMTLPVILRGTREGTNAWSWNGSVDKPTLRPSVLTKGHDFTCHTWINDGQAVFLDDCTHEFKGQTMDLLNVEDSIYLKDEID